MHTCNMLLGALILSTAPLFIRTLGGQLSPVGIAAGRMVVVFPLLLVLMKIEAFRLRKSLLPLPLKLRPEQLAGSLMFAVNGVFFAAALLTAKASMVYLVAASTPAYLLLFQFLLGGANKPDRIDCVLAGCIVLGLSAFFLLDPSGSSAFGVGCALAAGITFAGYMFMQKRLGKDATEDGKMLTRGTILQSVFLGLPIYCLIFILSHTFGILPEISTPASLPDDWPLTISMLIALGFQTALPAWLWAQSIREVSPIVAGVMPTLSAVWGPLWTSLVFGEPFGEQHELIGMTIVHGAVIIAVWLKSKQKNT